MEACGMVSNIVITTIPRIRLVWRAFELFVLFVLLPTLLLGYNLLARRNGWPEAPKIPLLIVFVIAITAALVRDPSFTMGALWNARALRPLWRPMLLRFALCAAGLALFTWLVFPAEFFALLRYRPGVWLATVILYPVVSVYPQEVVYRTFWYHRYAALFPHRAARIAANAAVFGYMHVVYENYWAVALTALGGLLFAHTYERSGSTFAVSVEHALYGVWVFTVGLGFLVS
jgi:membrane protease YdiL (CAAX protease family)